MSERLVEFVPSPCRDVTGEDGVTVPARFRGKVTLRRPDVDERYEWKEEFAPAFSGFSAKPESTGDSEADARAKAEWASKIMPVMRKMIKKSAPHYRAVDLERLSDGAKFTSFEDLSYDEGCDEILQEVAINFMKGFGPEKK